MNDTTPSELLGLQIQMLPTRFQNARLIGKGTFSNVYFARDTNLDREVAIKAIPDDTGSLKGARGAIDREIEVLSKLNHPGIIRLLDVTKIQGANLLIQPFCAKGTMDADANCKQQSYSARISSVDTLLQAMQYVHDQGWIHCDIKPANLLVDHKGTAFLSDFGEARQISTLSGSAELVGSVGYMAPEILKGEAGPSIRSEIYSIGVTLYELLTGERAFSGDAIIAMQSSVSKGVPAVKYSVPSSADWNVVLQKATSLDAKRRYGSVRELAADIQKIRENKPVSLRKVSTREHLQRWFKKEPVTASMIMSLVTVILIGTIASAASWLEASKQSELFKTNAAELLRRTSDSIAAKKELEESLTLANTESEIAKRSETEMQAAIDNIEAINKEMKAESAMAERLNSEKVSTAQALEQSQQKKNEIEQKATIIGKTADGYESKFQSDEYWRLLNQAKSHLEHDEYQPAIEALDKTPQKLRRAEYALLRGLIENRWRYPKRMELGTIEFDEEDDSSKFVAVSDDGRFFARCSLSSQKQLKILTVADGKTDTFNLPKLGGADRVWLRFNREANQLLIAVTSETKCSAYSLENLGGNWSFSGSPIQIDGQCFGVSEFNQGRAFLVCATNLPANEKVELVDSATGLTAWDYRFDSKILNVKLVTSDWLPKGSFVLLLSNRESILVVDDGAKLNHYKTNFSLSNQLFSVDLDFFMNQPQTNSLGLNDYSRESRSTSVSPDLPRDSVRNAYNKRRGEGGRLRESHREAFVHFAMPERNAWVREQGTVSYFVVNGRNGNLFLPLLNKSEGCFPLAISESNSLFAVVYPDPSKNSLFNRNSNQLPKAVLVRYDFGAKDLDKLVLDSSPFRDKTPLQVLSSWKGPDAPNAQLDFFIDTEDPEEKTSLASIQYRCFGPEGNHSETQKVSFRKRVSVIEPKVTNGTKYQIELDAGNAFEILKMEVELLEGQITELGTLKLKLKPKIAIDADAEFSIVGVVKNEKGEGLANASITATFLPRGTGARPKEVIQKTATDKDGNYRLDGHGLGRVSVRVELKGYLIGGGSFSTENSTTRELAGDFILRRPSPMRIKLRYAVSEHGSSSFVGNNIETGSVELTFDKYSGKSFEYVKGLEKRFGNFATWKRLEIGVSPGGACLSGKCAIGTADQSNFDSITEVEQIGNKDNLLIAGKSLLLYGLKPDKSRNVKDCCVKILVESIGYVDGESPEISNGLELVENSLVTLNPIPIEPRGGAIKISGDSAPLQFDFEFDSTQPLTIECVVRLSGTAEAMKSRSINGGVPIVWVRGLALKVGADFLDFAIEGKKENQYWGRKSNRLLPMDRWAHLAGCWNGKDEVHLYQDGEQVARWSTPFPLTQGKGGLIGGYNNKNLLNGEIDSVRISNVHRYRDRFKVDLPFQSDESTLRLYHFDEGGGEQAHDSSKSGSHIKVDRNNWTKAATER